jgi:hypothetical protein
MSIEISPESIDAIAQRVVELLSDRASGGEPLADAGELARRLKVERSWVYDHAMELGAIRLGGGSRPRLRFDVEAIEEQLRAEAAGPTSAAPTAGQQGSIRVRRRVHRGRVPLLPVPDSGGVSLGPVRRPAGERLLPC